MSYQQNQVSGPGPNTPYHTTEDTCNLQSINESTIFLHDGVLRSISLKALKDFESHAKFQDALTISSINQLEELIGIRSNNVDDLSKKIIKLATLHVQGIGLHHRYQWNVVERIWRYKYSRAIEAAEKEASVGQASLQQNDSENESASSSTNDVGAGGLGFKLSLCLLIPMLEAYATQNRDVALSAMKLIFEELSSFPVMSLSQENSHSLEKLEDLLGTWSSSTDSSMKESGPSAMIALACARGVISALLKTVLMLETVDKHQKFPVGHILRKLDDVRMKIGKPCGILHDKHMTTWQYDDRLLADSIQFEKALGTKSHALLEFSQNEEITSGNASTTQDNSEGGGTQAGNSRQANTENRSTRLNASAAATTPIPDEIHRYFVATDGSFLFVTGPDGKGLSKVGTGLRGTLQGWVYHNNVELNCGLLVYSNGTLISRPLELDMYGKRVDDKLIFGVTLNTATLKPEKLILLEPIEEFGGNWTTLGMTSDGSSVYLIRAEFPKDNGSSSPQTPSEGSSSSGATPGTPPTPPVVNVWLDILKIVDTSGRSNATVIPKQLKVPLIRQEEMAESDKSCLGEGRLTRRTRSVRITSSPPVPPSPPGSIQQNSQLESMNTTLNVTLKQLQTGVYISCGNYLTIIFSNNAQLFLPTSIGPTSGVAAIFRQYAPVISPSCSKSIGTQIHFCLNTTSPQCTKHDLLSLVPESSFFHGAIIPEVGATYDHVNNLIWTVNGSFADCWKNTGHIPLWKQNEMFRNAFLPGEMATFSLPSSTQVDARTVINAILRHCGIMANHYISGDKSDANIGFNSTVLKTLIELLFKYRSNFEGPELTSIFLILQAIVTQITNLDQGSEVYKDLYNVQVMILCILNDTTSINRFSSSVTVYQEACKLFAMSFDLLYTTPNSRNEFFNELHVYLGRSDDSSSTRECLLMLQDTILQQFSNSLDNPLTKYEDGCKWILDMQWFTKVIQRSNDEIRQTFMKVGEKEFALDEVILLTSNLPNASVSTRYIASVVNFYLRCILIQKSDIAISIFREVLKSVNMIVEACIEAISMTDRMNLAMYNVSEAVIKSSILAHGVPQILGFLSHDSQSIRKLFDELSEECVQLTVALSFLAKKMNPTQTSDFGDDWSSKVKILSPWNTKRVFESPHPIRDSHKVKETIIIPECRQLYVKFHPQSASQYDYDRLIFYSGSGVKNKICEFGGNYYGFGNRYFSGPGWARSLMKIDGNGMTYMFEMKSGREHSVPDKALWGYQFSVYPIFDYSDVQKPLRSEDDEESIAPVTTGFTTLAALHCIDVIQNIAGVLLQGNPPTVDEKHNGVLLENKLVCGLNWPESPVRRDIIVPRKFSAELIQKVKRCVGVPPLQMRTSIIEKIRAPELEELYLQCCFQHIGTNPYLNTDLLLSGNESSWDTEPTRDILRDIFRNIDTLFRKIMAFYEMEKMLCQEIEEISNHTKDITEAFFTDANFMESSSDLQTLAWICYLEYSPENPMNLVNDVIAMVTALSADGSVPQLTRTDELIEETHAKCKYLLQASQNIEMQIIGPAFPSSKTVLERLHNIHGFLSVHLYSPKCTINSFIEARRVRRERALDRIKGLDMLHKVLECSNPSSALLIVTAILLQQGPRLETILCSGEEREVIKIFGKVMKAAVTIADKNPLLHRFTIALLSVTKYDRTDEENLVESGLVGLLDQLCAYQTGQHHSKPEVSTEAVAATHNKASTLAWAAFQVLAAQCASWERVSNDLKTYENVWGDYIDSEWDEPEHRELPLQISINVTNHLARAAALAALSSSTPNQSWESSGPSCSPSLSVAIKDVLDLLSNLRTYKIGRAILKQGPCICRLLALLQDSRLSPRLVLTILKLLHTALPLVDDLDTQNCKQIVPRTSRSHGSGNVNTSINSFLTIIDSTPYTQVASMLLTKLADYLVCGPQQQHKLSENTSTNRHNCQPSRSQGVMIGLTDPKYERMEVWVHKTTDQSSSSLLRQLFVDTTRLDLKPTRGSLNDLDNELNSNGKVLLYTEESSWAERKALRISQLGHLVTLTPIGFSRPGYKSTGTGALNRGQSDLLCKDRNLHLSSWDPARPFLSGNVAENLASEIVQLVRALLFTKRDKEGSQSTSGKSSGSSSQGHVPSSTSVTSSSPETCSLGQESIVSDAAAQLTKRSAWCGAVEQVICGAMKLLPRLSQMPMNPTSSQLESYVYSARIIIAALTVLGGFTETIRPGLEVWIVDKKDDGNLVEGNLENEMEFNAEWEYKATKGKVISVSETCPTCKVEIISMRSTKNKASGDLTVSDTLTVPLCRVCPTHFKKTGIPHLPSLSRFTQIEIAGYLKTLLLTGSSATSSGSSKGHGAGQECPLKRSLPTLNQIVSSANNSSSPFSSINQVSESRQIAQAMTICRLLAEIRTKAMQVLSLWLKKKEFCNIFLGIGSESQFQKKFTNDVLEAMENMKGLSQECIPSHKQVSLDSQVAWMRLLYRDCTKPPRLPITTEKYSDEMRWDVQRAFPKIRSAVFSSISNTIVYTGDYNVTPGNPRGLVVFGSAVIPSTCYYWEATIVSMEDSGQHTDLIVVPPMSIGFSPLPSSTSGTGDVWKYPSGSCMYTTLGRVVHYKNQDPGSWVTLRLDDENFRIKSGDTIGIGWEKGENSGGGGGGNISGNAPTLPQRLRVFRTAMRNPSVSIVTPDTVVNGRRQRAARSSNQVNLELTISNVTNTNPPTGVRGVVFFTLNGRRLPPSVEQSNCNLHPILHIQKRQMVVHTNLGEKPFLYVDANKATSKQPPNSGTTGGPSSESRRNGTTETGTGNADVLLRRVSDSLQDLNLVFNLNVADFDSEQEFNINRSGSSSTVSEASNNSTNREEDWHNIPADEDDDGDNADADDDDEFAEVFSESSIVRMPHATARALRSNRSRQANIQPPLPNLPPTPVSGVSVSGSSIAVNRPTSSRRARHVATPRPTSARKEENSAAPQKGVLSFTSLLQSGSVGGYYGGHSHTKNELVAKPRPKMTDYNPTKSLEYFMPHSQTTGIRVFHGPRRYVCSCAAHCPTPLDFLLLEKPKDAPDKTQADMDALDGYEDEDDDDIHSLLVKAWEAQVFPVIRRRFRNESERRDGLEQIRGALQLGMLDIARQTVEFLYEEGGGVPRDMHFPTLEEVRTEATRCTVDKVKPGMSVNIRSLQDLTDSSSVLPNYGVGSMLSTFGLVGEVLEVDLVHDLVLVETYIEPEGVLVRFWYPVSCLDKSQSNKKPTLSTNTVNMFKLHSNLISMESSSCHLYTRQCYLSVCQHCHKNVVSNEESSIVENDTLKICPLAAQIFYDFDLDSIQILSDHFLASYPPTRDLFTYNLQCDSPSMKFLSDPGNPSVIFYKDPDYLSKCIRSKIREACKTGEDSVNELTGRLTHILECPDRFPYQDVQLDRISDLEVSLPGVAFSLVNFKGPQSNKHMTNIDNTAHPCVHISSYDSGEVCRYFMACYPLEPLHVVMHRSSGQSEDGTPIISHTAPTTTPANLAVNKTLRKRHIRFPPTMCPTDRIHLSISEMILPDVFAEIQGIPKEFPLCLLYIQELVSEIRKDSTNFTFGNVTTAVTRLIDFIDQMHLSPVIKDWIFTLIAELTRVKKDDMMWRPSPSEKVSRSCTPNRLFFELLLLRDKEVELTVPFYMSPIITAIGDNLESSMKGKHSKFAPPTLMDHISAFISCHQRFNKASTDPNFSFYFNSLNDLCLALNEVSEIMVNPYEIIPCSASTSKDPSPISSPQRRPSSSTGEGSDSFISLPIAVSTVVHLPNKRAIPKIIRKRGKDSKNKDVGKSHKNGQSGSSSSSSSVKAGQKQVDGTSSEDGLIAFAKASEIEWFNNQVVITRVLRDIVWHSPNDANCSEAAQVLISTILERLKTPTIHNRLLVISGAPVDIDGMSIEASLIRALRGCGGIHGNEMWISGTSAVVEIRSLSKVNEAYDLLKQNKVWYPLEDYVLYPNVNVYRVIDSLKVQDPQGDYILDKFLKSKLSDPEMPDKLSFRASETLTNIFMSCYSVTIPFVPEDNSDSGNEIVLSEEQITLKICGNLLQPFVIALVGDNLEVGDAFKTALSQFGEKIVRKVEDAPKLATHYDTEDVEVKNEGVLEVTEGIGKTECGQSSSHDVADDVDQLSVLKPPHDIRQQEEPDPPIELKGLSLRGFLDWCTELLRTQTNLLWKGLFSAGFDLTLERTWVAEDPPLIYNYFHSENWSLEKDVALIRYIDAFSQYLHIDPIRIQPPEVYLMESDFVNPSFACLQGVELPNIRIRWAMLQKMNSLLSKKLVAHVSVHAMNSTHRSLARLLHDSRQLLLYYTKDAFLYKVINISASRGSDTPTPEIMLDPVSSIGRQDDTTFKTQLCHIIQQMSTITTSFYTVPSAQGADPALPISVKFQGEEVLGLSGSYRHFLLNATKELQCETVKLLCRCPSADAGKNKDSFIITPGNLCYGEEDFLHFLGQLIGISIRSDAPLALSLLKATWRSLLYSEKEIGDSSDNLIEADILCATYLKKLESLSTKMAFDNFLSLNAWPKFHYPSMDNTSVVPLCQDGSRISLSFTNREQFIKQIKEFREKELQSKNKVTKILTGLATIVPLPAILGLFTSDHLELRIAGSPEINLSLLKSHTHYQVGVSENDPHIMYFWAALESFTPEELKKFIKFSANLERLPVTCPCQSQDHSQESSNANIVHAPPFPMKIAPIDLPSGVSIEEIDKRLIRVETCLFLIRLPPYSSLQVTRQQLTFAINCREDPLSG